MEETNPKPILPWEYKDLQKLLEGIIEHGTEAAKIDFKAEIELTSPEHKTELLKDITAIANTYDDSNHDHGFLIYGVKEKKMQGITATEGNTDKLQNTIEQLIKTYISPMLRIYVLDFETDTGKRWGVIVIPPQNSKPYMFFKDFSCQNPAKSRKRGEWFVRKGTTTDHGLPEDLALITQRQINSMLEPLKVSIRALQSRIAKVDEQYSSAMYNLMERALKSLPASGQDTLDNDIAELAGIDLSDRLKQKLRTPIDLATQDLLEEARKIRDFIIVRDTSLPWDIRPGNPEISRGYIEELEKVSQQFLVSIAVIILHDTKEEYINALMRSIKLLAVKVSTPSGIGYTDRAKALRYYPLLLVLYTVSICCVAADRPGLLKQIFDLSLKDEYREDYIYVTYVYFFSYDAKRLFNDIFESKKCEPISTRIRQFINDQIGDMFIDFSEPEYFFPGEFVLALNNISVSIEEKRPEDRFVPLGGLYLYIRDASKLVSVFIKERPEFLEKVFSQPVSDILKAFDSNASKMGTNGCFADAFEHIKTADIYNNSKEKLKK